VASEAFDHTSALRFLEQFTGVQEPNISTWRRAAFGDFISAFHFTQPQSLPPLLPDDTARQLEKAKEQVATLPAPTLPGDDQFFPHQETGDRPHV
jgi:phospholipase C